MLVKNIIKLFKKKPLYTKFNGFAYRDGTVYSLAEKGLGYKVSEHFTLTEFACNDGNDRVLIHDSLPPLLEAIREAAGGKPIHINSGYRTNSYNHHIGGASSSRHKTGQAADITVRGLSPRRVYRIAKKLNPGGLGGYNSFTHVDIQGFSRRWGKRYRF